MLKSILKISLIILSVIVLFLLQLYIFNNIYIFGARFNVIAIFCIIFAMLTSLRLSIPVSMIVGLLSDVLLGGGKLEYLLIFMIIAIVIESLKLLYKQDSSLSVAIYGAAGFIALEIISSIFTAINSGITINIFSYIFFVLKVLIINIPICYLMYYIAIKVNEKMER